jgi:hypothetical protein
MVVVMVEETKTVAAVGTATATEWADTPEKRLRKQLLDDLADRFEQVSRTLNSDPTLTIEDAGALVSAACVDFNAKWEALLTRMPASGSRLKLVVTEP